MRYWDYNDEIEVCAGYFHTPFLFQHFSQENVRHTAPGNWFLDEFLLKEWIDAGNVSGGEINYNWTFFSHWLILWFLGMSCVGLRVEFDYPCGSFPAHILWLLECSRLFQYVRVFHFHFIPLAVTVNLPWLFPCAGHHQGRAKGEAVPSQVFHVARSTQGWCAGICVEEAEWPLTTSQWQRIWNN